MTDRELLEAAAKAGGYHANQWADPGELLHDKGGWVQFIGYRQASIFNPLTDDGDALRLAAKLYLWEAIRLAHRDVSADVDIYAATRRAIVHAAAAMAPRPVLGAA